MYTTPRIYVFKPFLSATVAMVVTGLLIALDHSLIFIESHVVAGLWVILLMSILFMIMQIAHTEKAFSKQFAQLAAQKERLASEIEHRIWAEKTSSENKTRLQIVDENFPVMLAYFNAEQRCHYHNRAFRQWFGLQPEQIENRLFNEFLDKPLFSDISSAVERVLSGETRQNQHILQLANQSMCFITSHLTPHFDSAGKVIGFYILYTPRLMKKGEELPQNVKNRHTTEHKQVQESEMMRDSNENTVQHPTRVSIDSSRRIIQAIEQNEFHLYCQKIIPAGSNQESVNYYEVLIRMAEEESNLIPPGAFLPFVEKYNLMPRLDGWVVEQVIHYLADQKAGSRASFCINLARSTLIDSVFADRIRKLLNVTGIDPRRICFEIETADMTANLPSAVQFVKKYNNPVAGFHYAVFIMIMTHLIYSNISELIF